MVRIRPPEAGFVLALDTSADLAIFFKTSQVSDYQRKRPARRGVPILAKV